MKISIFCLSAFILVCTNLFSAEEPPLFSKKPLAIKKESGVVISFAVNKVTDVTIAIEDDKGKIIRHLVSGFIGAKAPSPLQSNSLEQSIEWDGKADFGKLAGAGPFSVRVSIGLNAKFDKVLGSDSQNLGSPRAIAVGKDGTVYVCTSTGAALPNWGSEYVVAIDRDGNYIRTVLPFPANLKKEEIAGYGTYDLDGQSVPLLKSISQRRFHSNLSPRKGPMIVTPDDILLKVTDAGTISAFTTKGTTPWEKEAGPKILELQRLQVGRSFLCSSSDGQRAFVTGLGDKRPGKKPENISFSSVYVVKLPDRGSAQPFFGKPEESGKDSSHLSDNPRGLALDGKGHLLISDFKNDRIVAISEKDGAFVGELAIVKPDGICIDQKTGILYVISLAKGGYGELIKLNNWKEGKELARLTIGQDGNPDFPPVFAIDSSTQPIIIWMGTDGGSLFRIEDKGNEFEKKIIGSKNFASCAFEGIEVDRYASSPDIYARNATGSFGGSGEYWRFNEGDEKWTKVKFPGSGGVGGTCIVPGLNNIIYAPTYPQGILRFDRDGKPIPWPIENTKVPEINTTKSGKPSKIVASPLKIYGPVSMVYMTHTLGVRPSDGHFFFFDPGKTGDRPHKMLREYTPEGKLVREDPIVWKASDNCVGPKFDQWGNIYVSEQVKPANQAYPPEFEKHFGKIEIDSKTGRSKNIQSLQNISATMYGSIVKFSPKGGMFHFTANSSGGGNPYQGEPKFDPTLKTEDYASFYQEFLYPLKVTGAEWVHMGISHQALHYCNCENTRFDVDLYGRVWYPDLGRFRVCVLDTNGNEITHFGSYGNADSCGPDSKDKSLAQPELAFTWLIGVGVTDKYAYMGDSINRRMLRAKLVYAADEVCEIK